MRSFGALMRLIRWPNCLITVLAVIATLFLLPASPSLTIICFASLAAVMITGYGNIFNDLVDLEADRINHPERPLPAGQIRVSSAKLWMFAFLLIGLALASRISHNSFLIAALIAAMLFMYNVFAKKVPLLSNLWIALIGLFTFVYAGYAGPSYKLWELNLANAGGIFAFLFHLGREIIKDLQDIEGDKAANIKTLANTCPRIIPKLIATSAYIMLFGFAVLLYVFLKPGSLFVVIFILGIFVPATAVLVLLWKSDTQNEYRKISAVLKALMPVGLAALLAARFQVSP